MIQLNRKLFTTTVYRQVYNYTKPDILSDIAKYSPSKKVQIEQDGKLQSYQSIKILGYLQSIGDNFKHWSLKNSKTEKRKNISKTIKRATIIVYTFDKNLGMIRRKKEVLLDISKIDKISDKFNQEKYGMMGFEEVLSKDSNFPLIFYGDFLEENSNTMKVSAIINPKKKFDFIRSNNFLKLDQNIKEVYDTSRLMSQDQVLVDKFDENNNQLNLTYLTIDSMSSGASRFVKKSIDFREIYQNNEENLDLAKLRFLQFKNNLSNPKNDSKLEMVPDLTWDNDAVGTKMQINFQPRLVSNHPENLNNSKNSVITTSSLIVLSDVTFDKNTQKSSFLALLKVNAPFVVQVQTDDDRMLRTIFMGKILNLTGVLEYDPQGFINFRLVLS